MKTLCFSVLQHKLCALHNTIYVTATHYKSVRCTNGEKVNLDKTINVVSKEFFPY